MAEEKVHPALLSQDITILGRTMTVKPVVSLGPDKMRLLAQIGLRLSKGIGTFEDLLRLDRLISELFDPADNNWLEDQVADGVLTTEQILAELKPVFDKLAEGSEPAKKKTTGRAVRGR